MSYAIPDEPEKTSLGHLVVRPSAPLLAAMLCGGWLAWPWYVFNAIAIGSPTRRKEIKMCAIAVAGTVALAFVISTLLKERVIDSLTVLRFALLAVTAWKLSWAYAVCNVQSRTFEVYTYYGGAVRSALYVLVAGYYLRGMLAGMTDDPFWLIVIMGGL